MLEKVGVWENYSKENIQLLLIMIQKSFLFINSKLMKLIKKLLKIIQKNIQMKYMIK